MVRQGEFFGRARLWPMGGVGVGWFQTLFEFPGKPHVGISGTRVRRIKKWRYSAFGQRIDGALQKHAWMETTNQRVNYFCFISMLTNPSDVPRASDNPQYLNTTLKAFFFYLFFWGWVYRFSFKVSLVRTFFLSFPYPQQCQRLMTFAWVGKRGGGRGPTRCICACTLQSWRFSRTKEKYIDSRTLDPLPE